MVDGCNIFVSVWVTQQLVYHEAIYRQGFSTLVEYSTKMSFFQKRDSIIAKK
jgi:hypothetical protein